MLSIRWYFFISGLLHVIIFCFLYLHSILKNKDKMVQLGSSSLRVDIVALPKNLKTESVDLPSRKGLGQIAPAVSPNASSKSRESAKNRESAEQGIFQSKNKKALARIKAIEELSQGADNASSAYAGNVISSGHLSTSSASSNQIDGSEYFLLIQETLQKNWELPLWLVNQPLSAKAKIWINAQGNIERYILIQSSGNKAFDEYVLQCIEHSSPLPPPIEALRSSLLTEGITVGFPL